MDFVRKVRFGSFATVLSGSKFEHGPLCLEGGGGERGRNGPRNAGVYDQARLSA